MKGRTWLHAVAKGRASGRAACLFGGQSSESTTCDAVDAVIVHVDEFVPQNHYAASLSASAMRNQSLLLLVLACVLAAHVTLASAAQSNEVQYSFVRAPDRFRNSAYRPSDQPWLTCRIIPALTL